MKIIDRYEDRVSYYVEVFEAAFRPGSVETNWYRNEYYGNRYYSRGVWYIHSSTTGMKTAWRGPLHSFFSPPPVSKGLVEARMYRGSAHIGEYRELDEETVLELAETVKSVERSQCIVEAVFTMVHESRSIVHRAGGAKEEKNYTDVLLAAKCGSAALSARLGFAGFIDRTRLKSIASVASNLVHDAMAYRAARRLSPAYTGRWQVVLAGDAAGALLHEIGHLLAAGAPGSLEPGSRIGPDTMSIRDDPFYYDSPAQRFFDDEGVEASRRTLVEAGIVVSRLNTRETAVETGEEPGNAHGLFHRPVPGHTTLAMAPGDWRLREILEETRRGVMVLRVHEAFVDENRVVTIIPEDGWLVQRGGVSPLRVSRIRLRVPEETLSIDAVARDSWLRIGSEKSSIVAEAAPSLRLYAFVD